MPTANVNGFEMYFEEHGSGEPIVFHHGFTGSHDAFLPIAERLRDRYRCVLVDARGAGDSERAETGYSIEQYAADVVGLADHLGLDRFAYVGHSLGGGVGFQLGLDHGDRLTRLVLVTPISADGYAPDPAQTERSRKLRAEGARDQLVRERLAGVARSELAVDGNVASAVDRALSVSAGHYDGMSQAMADFRVGARLDELTAPTLMVTAAADGLLDANLADFQRLPNATLHVFSRVAHGVPLEVPAAFARVIADFMEHGVVNAQTMQERVTAAQAMAAAT